ncbi:LOW QUALITY PROTEIN: hypothetical protein U9M48_002684 [Paspalum notatum var. saurae]|uniref:Uncharacterized protein n=1 Tax=Paspalum notatum var. saurae TaxID=547442 RepID=A0AAQ3PLG6_PASNO
MRARRCPSPPHPCSPRCRLSATVRRRSLPARRPLSPAGGLSLPAPRSPPRPAGASIPDSSTLPAPPSQPAPLPGSSPGSASLARASRRPLKMSRRFKQVAKRFVGKMIPSKERLFQGSTSIGSGREALLRCVDSKLQGVPIALQRNEDEEDEEADGEDAGDRQENEEAGDR